MYEQSQAPMCAQNEGSVCNQAGYSMGDLGQGSVCKLSQGPIYSRVGA